MKKDQCRERKRDRERDRERDGETADSKDSCRNAPIERQRDRGRDDSHRWRQRDTWMDLTCSYRESARIAYALLTDRRTCRRPTEKGTSAVEDKEYR